MGDLTGLFFIFFDSRSGSTFLANLLSKNKDVVIPPESNFLPRLFNRYFKDDLKDLQDINLFLDIIFSENKFSDWRLEKEALFQRMSQNISMSLGRAIICVCEAYRDKVAKSARIFGLKKDYTKYYSAIRYYFPDAKIIGLIRDGRGVFNSQKKSIYSKTGRPFETNPFNAAERWSQMARRLRLMEKESPSQTLIIHYEDLVENEAKILKMIGKFLDFNHRDMVKKEEGYQVPHRYADLHKNIAKPPIRERIIAWQKELTEEEIFAFESKAFPELLKEGYDLIFTKELLRNPWRRFLVRLKLITKKSFLALL